MKRYQQITVLVEIDDSGNVRTLASDDKYAIAYVRDYRETGPYVIVPIDGRLIRAIVPCSESEKPKWFPNGKRVVAIEDSDGEWTIYPLQE